MFYHLKFRLLCSPSPDASTTSTMVGSLASIGSSCDQRLQGHDQVLHAHTPDASPAKRCLAAVSTRREGQDEATDLQAQPVPSTRQCPREIRQMPGLRDPVAMERQPRGMGTTSSWTKGILISLATLAAAVFGNHSYSGQSNPRTNEQAEAFAVPWLPDFQGQGQSEESFLLRHGDTSLDQLRDHEPPHRSPDGSATAGVVQHPPTGKSSSTRSNFMGDARLPERGELPPGSRRVGTSRRPEEMGSSLRDGSPDQPGQRGLRVGHRVKNGALKYVRGTCRKAAQVLEAEYDIYHSTSSASTRLHPCVDLWELFAGEATCSLLAHEYGLDALQPWDLLHGQDLRRPSTRQEAMKVLRRFRPLLTLMGIDCKHYNRFNRNLNCAHRLDQWYDLQANDKPLLDIVTKIATEQHQSGRYFLIENPQNSELWDTPQMQRLAALPGVWTVVIHAGSFGAQIDGHLIRKAFKFMGNCAPLHEDLRHRRLSPLQVQERTPIQGSLNKKSQAYPEELCRLFLEHLQREAHFRLPQRFCRPHHVLAAQVPSTDLSQWDPIVEDIDKKYLHTAKRPYYVSLGSPMANLIQDLLRIDACKIQVVANPTVRRFLSLDEPFDTRACFLLYSDNSKSVEVEDLGDIQFPRQRFSRPVRLGIFVFGTQRKIVQPPPEPSRTPNVVPGLETDITFPNLKPSVSAEIRSMVARMHCNLGHPSRPELVRLLAYENVPDDVLDAARRLNCATCSRLQPPQKPRPSTMPKSFVGQFADEIQLDIFFCRTLKGTTFMVLGAVDRATGLHQAIITPDRNADTVFDQFEKMWLRPYGIPLKVMADPDTSFRGSFQQRLEALGCQVDHCPPEAHHIIGMVERRNSLLRTILEKLIDQFAATTIEECSTLLMASCHAINSTIHTHGRSAYQAVFGRQPRLPDSNFSDPTVLASSSQVAHLPYGADAPANPEIVRSEAIKTLRNLDVSKHLGRALLRKTRHTKVADVQPGQRCAYWRWTKKGQKKRGSWVIGRFLSWGPAHVGKQAWVKTATSTTLVTAEQMRCAFGFEDWTPSKEDIQVLKDASTDFGKYLMDDRGPEPPQEEPHPSEILEEDLQALPPPTPSMMVPATPQAAAATNTSAAPATPVLPHISQQQQNIHVNEDGPTHVHHHNIQQEFHRYGDLPRAPRTPHSRTTRSRTPVSKRTSGTLLHAEPPALAEQPAQQEQPVPEVFPQAAQAVSPPVQAETILDSPLALQATGQEEQHTNEQPSHSTEQSPPEPIAQAEQTPAIAASSASPHASQSPAEVQPDSPQEPSTAEHHNAAMVPQPLLPQKRALHETLNVLAALDDRQYYRIHSYTDGSPPLAYGHPHKGFHYAYLQTKQRQQDTKHLDKPAHESDTSQDSDTDSDTSAAADTNHSTAAADTANIQEGGSVSSKMPLYKRGLSRQELKAIDREIPWRKIFEMPAAYIDKFLAAINQEAFLVNLAERGATSRLRG